MSANKPATQDNKQPILPHEMYSQEIEQAVGDAELVRDEILHKELERLESADELISTARMMLSSKGFDHISSRCGEIERMFGDLYRLINQEMDGMESITKNLHDVALDHLVEPNKFIRFWLAAFPTNHRIEDMNEWAKRLNNTSQLAQISDATKTALRDAGYKIELVI